VADKKPDTTAESPDPVAASSPRPDQSLSQFLVQVREHRGFTRDQIIADAHVPLLYLKMIETDDYGLISDRLYLIPFIRKYATFLGLDPEDIASRFVSDMQHAESSVVRMSEPITVARKRRGILRSIVFGILVLMVLILIGDLVWRRFNAVRESIEPAVAAPSITPLPSTTIATPAPLTILPTVIPALPQALPTIAQPVVRATSVPTAAIPRRTAPALAPRRKVPARDD
jgi:cytoskeletal protein RodZ